MSQFPEFDSAKQPRSKVELHVHLGGSVRLTTIWELAQKKGIPLNVKTLEDLYEACSIKFPTDLADFLKLFAIFSPILVGDAEAIERVAYEFCADSAKQGVLYSEVRYNPHLLSTTHSPIKASTGPLTPREVVRCVNRGFVRGSADFNISMRSILCCIRSHPEWSNDVLELCIEFQNDGVVGIDVAGDEATGLAAPEIVAAFQVVYLKIMHGCSQKLASIARPMLERLVRQNVLTAMRDMLVERVGHGYHVVEDDAIYEECLQRGLHFEICPYSSVLTGSVSLTARKHPIVRFAEDNANFSVSRDDPTITQRTLDEEYQFLRGFGLKDVHLTRANFNAARSSFLPSDGKQYLIQKLNEIYGTCDTTTSASNIYEGQNNGGMIQQLLGHFWTTK